MNLKWAKDSRGLTLIELLVTLAMIGFIIAALYTFYLAGLRGWQRGTDRMEAQQSARIAMDRIIYEVRFACDVSIHDQGREMRFRVIGDSRTLRFRLVGEELVFESYPTGSWNYFHTKVALGINDLHFAADENRLLTITLSAGPESGETRLSSSVRPRNLSGGGQ